MKDIMNARERVIAALDHQRPDRLPRYEIFFPSFIKQWENSRQAVSHNEDIRELYQIDIPFVLASHEGPFWSSAYINDQGGSDYLIQDSWGRLLRQQRDSSFFEVLEPGIKTRNEIDQLTWENLSELVQETLTPDFVSKINDVRFAPVTGVMGLFMAATYLRGETEFMMDLLEDEIFCKALVERLQNYLTELGLLMLEATNTWGTAIWVYDDFSIKTGPLISPAIFEKIFRPAYKSMFAAWKARGARHIILHHDVMNENSYPIIDMFADAGLDGVQGVYPGGGLSAAKFKQRYGRRLSIIGGMDNTKTLPFGNRQSIENEVALIAEVSKDGGVIIGSHSIEGYISVENYDYYHLFIEKINESW